MSNQENPLRWIVEFPDEKGSTRCIYSFNLETGEFTLKTIFQNRLGDDDVIGIPEPMPPETGSYKTILEREISLADRPGSESQLEQLQNMLDEIRNLIR